MSNLYVNSLSVDLLQKQASIGLFRPASAPQQGLVGFTSVNIQVQLDADNNASEAVLKRKAIEAAKAVLREALETLNNFPV